ncbi:MAG: hypothetical protein GY817_02805 [bacterium]|nr:hypothetical protein [bacterium]
MDKKIYEPLFKELVEGYKKGALPFQLSKDKINLYLSNIKNDKIKFKSGVDKILKLLVERLR